MSFCGVDLGTYAVKPAVFDDLGRPRMLTNGSGEPSFRSVVFFDKGNKILVGEEAMNAGLIESAKCVANWKRNMGTDTVLFTSQKGRKYFAKDICLILLEQVKTIYQERTGQILTHIAISIPANYKQRQREETQAAAEAAGLKVVGLFHEPSAGAWGNSAYERGDGIYLVLDMGGGTFDVSIVRVSGNSTEVITTNGVEALGGMDYHRALLEHCLREFECKTGLKPDMGSQPVFMQDLHQKVERAKITLSMRDAASIAMACDGQAHNVQVSRKEYEKLTENLTHKAMQCAEQTLKEGGITLQDVREIMAIGGGSLMPGFRNAIEKCFGRKPTEHNEPHFAVSLGTAMLGRLAIEKEGGKVLGESGRMLPPCTSVFRETTSHHIGVCVANQQNVLVNSVLIPKGTRIPCDITESFQLKEPGQTGAGIELLQGLADETKEKCQSLGEAELEGLPAVFDKPHVIEIRGRIDKSGIITATAYDPLCGKSVEFTAQYKKEH